MALSGTPSERQQQKADRRRKNEMAFHRQALTAARTGHDELIAATQAAKAASKHFTDEASRRLAVAITGLVDEFDTVQNRRPS